MRNSTAEKGRIRKEMGCKYMTRREDAISGEYFGEEEEEKDDEGRWTNRQTRSLQMALVAHVTAREKHVGLQHGIAITCVDGETVGAMDGSAVSLQQNHGDEI